MPEIREQAKNCIEMACFSLKIPPVRGDTRGGKVFVPPGRFIPYAGKKERNRPKSARARLAVD